MRRRRIGHLNGVRQLLIIVGPGCTLFFQLLHGRRKLRSLMAECLGSLDAGSFQGRARCRSCRHGLLARLDAVAQRSQRDPLPFQGLAELLDASVLVVGEPRDGPGGGLQFACDQSRRRLRLQVRRRTSQRSLEDDGLPPLSGFLRRGFQVGDAGGLEASRGCPRTVRLRDLLRSARSGVAFELGVRLSPDVVSLTIRIASSLGDESGCATNQHARQPEVGILSHCFPFDLAGAACVPI